MKTQEKLAVEYISTETIKPYGNNPKIHGSKQVQQIVDSIAEFTFTNPILIDENGVILAGHGRLLAAKKLDMKNVPVIRLLHLSDAQKKAYRIADNKLTECGEWDQDLLTLEFQDLDKLELDFSLDITGFDNADIDVMIDSSLTEKKVKLDEKANAVPFIAEDEIVSKAGDVWQLGKHRIICGNSLDKKTYEQLFENKKAHMIFTDPPYNVPISGHVCGNGKIKHKEFAMASGEMSSEEFQTFLKTAFSLMKEFSVDGSLHYSCMDWRHISEIIGVGLNVYDSYINLCVWNKSIGGMGSFYRSKHELIFIFKNGNEPHINNVELGSHGRYRCNVWDYAGVNSFGKEQDNQKFHPTVKPVELVKDAILDATKRGQIVLDSFLGSGTTLIAAEECGRICYGIEIEPLYTDTIIRRWEEITGKDAIHVESGKTYKELSENKKKGEKDGQ